MKKARIVLDKDFRIGKVDEKVFSSFVEPLGRCIYGGLYEPGHPEADRRGFRKDVQELIRPLDLTLNRFPGGNFVSTYRWEDGIGPKEQRPRRAEVAWQCIETNEFGLNEFAEWSREMGSDVMMTVNLATRGVLEAMDCVEYCNFAGGTYWSDLRKAHGYAEPHGYKYWCLTNEIDGIWQVGQKTGSDYGKLAREASKGMKLLDGEIRTVLAGSSSPGQDTFPEFDREALEQSYDFVDYLSIHHYLFNKEHDTANYLAKPLKTDKFMKDAAAVCDYVQAKNRSPKKVNISFDEFNTWDTTASKEKFVRPWEPAKPLLENSYTMEDALVLGGMLLAVLRNADRVEIACLSELVNCISHIRTRNGGGAWVLPPYYVFLHFCQYGRGTALHTAVDSPLYDSIDFTDVPYLDTAAVVTDKGNVVCFAVNRSQDSSLRMELELRGFQSYTVREHIVLESAAGNLTETNTEEKPNTVVPHRKGNAGMDGDAVFADLPKLSWNVIILEQRQDR